MMSAGAAGREQRQVCAGADHKGRKEAGSFQSWLRHLGVSSVWPRGLLFPGTADSAGLWSSGVPHSQGPCPAPGRCGGPREAPLPSARPNPLTSEDAVLRPGVVPGCGAIVLQNRDVVRLGEARGSGHRQRGRGRGPWAGAVGGDRGRGPWAERL